jgi:hypothetical protein
MSELLALRRPAEAAGPKEDVAAMEGGSSPKREPLEAEKLFP